MGETPQATTGVTELAEAALAGDRRALARLLTAVENRTPVAEVALRRLYPVAGTAHLVGITGPPGSGKSTLVAALIGVVRAAGRARERQRDGSAALGLGKPVGAARGEHDVVRPAVDEATDDLAATRAVDHAVVVGGAECVGQLDPVARGVDRDALDRTEARRGVLGHPGLQHGDEAVGLTRGDGQ